jgi:hypothetical protein
MGVLLRESNVISLRTAMIRDGERGAFFGLLRADPAFEIPKGRTWVAPKDFDWAEQDCVWLYRHTKLPSDQEKMPVQRRWWDRYLMPLEFEKPPEFKLHWADSGNSVALYLNARVWAFIEETTHLGYSKGIIDPQSRNVWNEELFRQTFPDAQDGADPTI